MNTYYNPTRTLRYQIVTTYGSDSLVIGVAPFEDRTKAEEAFKRLTANPVSQSINFEMRTIH